MIPKILCNAKSPILQIIQKYSFVNWKVFRSFKKRYWKSYFLPKVLKYWNKWMKAVWALRLEGGPTVQSSLKESEWMINWPHYPDQQPSKHYKCLLLSSLPSKSRWLDLHPIIPLPCAFGTYVGATWCPNLQFMHDILTFCILRDSL